MTSREQRRAWVLTRVLKHELTMTEAAEALGLSERQLWRLRVAFERDGPAGLGHGNRGRPSARRLEASLRARVIELRRTTYQGVNDTHLAELLAEREGIEVSRPSLQRILRAAGVASPRRRRPPRHRSRRERMAAEGLLLQLDGSRHDWLEERGPRLTLVGAIDDATGIVPAATFRDQEDAAAYLEILQLTIAGHGLPGALYHDRHSAFAPTSPGPAEPGAPDELSQVGRANARFAVPPADPVPAWRPLPPGVRLDRVLVFKYRCKVGRDHTIRLDGQILQLPPGRGGRGYAGRLVEVHGRLDGSIVAFDGTRELAVRPAPPDPVQLRAQGRDRPAPGLVPEAATVPWTPPPDHPWRRVRKGTKLYQQRLTESLNS